MPPAVFQDLRLGPSPLERVGRPAFRVLLCVWLLFYGLFVGSHFTSLWAGQHWPAAVLLLLTCTVAMANAVRQLPLQNVLAAGVIVGGMGGVAHGINALTGIPFGPCVYSQDIGRLLFDFFAWPMPFIWVVFVVTSRGTARLLLRPWRLHRFYGFILIGVTVGLVVLLDVGLEVYASGVNSFWEWGATRVPVDFFGVPLVNFLGWSTSGLLVLVFATPFLISKKPGPPPGPDFVPLLLWGLIGLGLGVGVFAGGVQGAGVVQGVATAVVVAVAVWNGWNRR
jgi:uncharacterized membrane protein